MLNLSFIQQSVAFSISLEPILVFCFHIARYGWPSFKQGNRWIFFLSFRTQSAHLCRNAIFFSDTWLVKSEEKYHMLIINTKGGIENKSATPKLVYKMIYESNILLACCTSNYAVWSGGLYYLSHPLRFSLVIFNTQILGSNHRWVNVMVPNLRVTGLCIWANRQ